MPRKAAAEIVGLLSCMHARAVCRLLECMQCSAGARRLDLRTDSPDAPMHAAVSGCRPTGCRQHGQQGHLPCYGSLCPVHLLDLSMYLSFFASAYVSSWSIYLVHLCSQPIHLSSQPICLSSIFPSIRLSIYLSLCPSIFLSVFLSYLSYLSFRFYLSCLSIHLSFFPSIHPTICLSVCLSVCPPNCRYI